MNPLVCSNTPGEVYVVEALFLKKNEGTLQNILEILECESFVTLPGGGHILFYKKNDPIFFASLYVMGSLKASLRISSPISLDTGEKLEKFFQSFPP